MVVLQGREACISLAGFGEVDGKLPSQFGDLTVQRFNALFVEQS